MASSAFLFTEYIRIKAILDEKEKGVVPCWKREDSPVPEVAGVIVINSDGVYTISHYSKGVKTVEAEKPEEIYLSAYEIISRLFKNDMEYAADKNCYIRMQIINKTNGFEEYRKFASVLKDLGIVLING
jgi:hypothetical protein